MALGPTAREKRMLDGRNRLAACKLAGVKPRFIQYTGDSPVAFIVAANLKRRHLDKGQKIALALEIEPLFAEEARKRMAAGGGDHGNQYTGGKPGVGKSPTPAKSRNQPQSQKVGNVPPLEKAKARDQAAVAVPVPPPCAALPRPWPPPPVVLYLYQAARRGV